MAIRLEVKDGQLVVEALDIKGPSCKDTLQQVIDATKVAVTDEKPKDDFYAAADIADQLKTKGT